MKIDPNSVLKDYEGNAIKMAENGPDATFSRLAIQALNMNAQEDSGPKKWERYLLSKKLHRAAVAEQLVGLTVEEAGDIKMVVGKYFAPVVVGAMYEVIEGSGDGIATE